MRDVNKIILVGRLGKDPETHATRSGIPLVTFSLATSRRIKPGTPEPEGGPEDSDTESGVAASARSRGASARGNVYPMEETQWHRIVAWGKQGEQCAQYLYKGRTVYVEGMVRTRQFTGKDGVTRYMNEVHADSVVFLGQNGRTSMESLSAEVTTDAAL